MLEIIFFILALILVGYRELKSWSKRGALPDSRADYRNNYTSVQYDYAVASPMRFERRRANRTSDPLLGFFSFCVVFAFIFSPIIGVILLIAAVIIYRLLKDNEKNRGAKKRRKEALLRAGAFLSPYTDMWRNLTMSNKYCSLKLRADGTTIIGVEKTIGEDTPYRTFKITETSLFDKTELWNMFCINFSYNTSFDGLIELCELFRASAVIDIITPPVKRQPQIVDKVDINNASGAELTALPGINIVLSKKIIKKREEIGGFNDIESFLVFLNLKPNVTENLRQRICVKKMKGNLKITRNNERTLDL